jgi:hypothetical protein
MHDLVKEALAAVVVITDAAASVIPEQPFLALKQRFASAEPPWPHAHAIFAANELDKAGLGAAARQLQTLGEQGLAAMELQLAQVAAEGMREAAQGVSAKKDEARDLKKSKDGGFSAGKVKNRPKRPGT